MEELFRFVVVRPVQAVDVSKNSIRTYISKELHTKLKEARTSENASAKFDSIALDYSESTQAIHSIDELKYSKALQKLFQGLKDHESKPIHELAIQIKKEVGVTPNEIVKDAFFKKDREHLSDTLLINVILGYDIHVSSYEAEQILRTSAIIERVAIGDATIAENGGLANALELPILLPEDIFPLTKSELSSEVQPTTISGDSEADPQRTMLLAERDHLTSTYEMLTHMTPDHIVMPESSSLINKSTIGKLHTLDNLPPIVRPEGEDNASSMADDSRNRVVSEPNIEIGGIAGPLLLKPSVVAAMSDRQRSVLSERGIDPTKLNLMTIVDRLSVELHDVEAQLTKLDGMNHRGVLKIGSTYVNEAAIEDNWETGTRFTSGIASGVDTRTHATPTSHATIKSVGVGYGDLLVVKQFLKRYEGRELAHVENILKGEFKERWHRRSRTTEETITVDTEMKREEERDQQTTERFELKTEASQIQKEDTSTKIGLALSGRYGPFVEFKASADFAWNQAKEEASKVATSYSKDITNRATSRIFERRREERILKTIEVFEEKNSHGVDNKKGSGHVVGQYQWIDKIYEAQVYNYGARMLFDIMIPEPAAFLLLALKKQVPKAVADLIKPEPFTVDPNDISEFGYSHYVTKYDVVGVTPPPPPFRTVSKSIQGKSRFPEGEAQTLEIPIPDGYEAIGDSSVKGANYFSGGRLDYMLMPELTESRTGTITLVMIAYRIEAFFVSVGIICRRTQRALDEWKLKTHAAILQAYQKQLRDYEEKLAALEIQAAQQIQGQNPGENEQLIRTELKKQAISVFTAQHYDSFGAIFEGGWHYPQIDLNEAEVEGKYIRFFEQAFEWEQMTYLFYPYYWGRKENWLNRVLLPGVDPLFTEFLKAGSVRVLVPVREGFGPAVAYFLNFGKIWMGGDVPKVSKDPLYVPIIKEILEREKAPGKETPEGQTWDVRLPTSLIILRDNAKLPAWQKNAKGEWIPV